MPKAKKKPLPRYWKTTISRITGLRYCDRHCDCGENAQLWYTPVPGDGEAEPLLPGWMNGVGTNDVWDWLVETGRV